MAYSDDITDREIEASFLTAEEVEKTSRPLERASVLPLTIYNNRAFYEREVEAALRPCWHALARIDQLQETGAFVTGEIVGEPVIVIRDKAGTIRALSNVCQHRASRLVSGCGVAKALMCPFHTWTYNLDGTLRGAPHMNKIDDFDRKGIKLPEFKVETWQGFVFVNLDQDAEPLAPQLGDLAEKIAPFRLEEWTTHPWRELEVDWNWKISMENFTEAYHHVGVHQNTIGKVSLAEKAIYEETNNAYSLFYVHIDAGEEHGGSEFLPDESGHPFPYIPGLSKFFHEYSPVVNVYPTFHLVLGPNFMLWLRFEIQGANQHKLYWQWLVPPGAKDLPNFEDGLKELAGLMDPVVAEDVGFMPNIKMSLGSKTFKPGRYCDQERAIHQMHLWLMERMRRHDALVADPA